ncbi:MAG TPA: RICIN domain-containing protein [Streptosporangiaceae bacterium]|nr:RICIN domain-containing protein [Streptosporangiaceae bacterium]
MMRKPRRLVVALAVSAMVAAGAVATSQLAHAQDIVAGTCMAPGDDANCNVSETITDPSSILVTVSVTPRLQYPTYQWTMECSLGSQVSNTSGSGAALTPYTQSIPLPWSVPDSCNVSVTAQMPSAKPTNEITLTVSYTTGSPSSSSSGPVSLIRGYDGKCVDDKGNSSADGTKVIIWGCNSSDSAQGWTYTDGELRHDGMCANDASNGGSGSHVILWGCNGGANEKWFHSSSNGEYILSLSGHGLLCLDDPGYSKTNGTQLIVYTCHNSSNQHWST